MEIPEGFTKLDASVYLKDDVLIVTGVLAQGQEFSFVVKLADPGSAGGSSEDDPSTWGPPPQGFEWTGELRPPRKGEYFWSELRGDAVRAVEDETGVNRLGEKTGGRKILRPVEPPRPERTGLRLVK
jgi:hypothetical protein